MVDFQSRYKLFSYGYVAPRPLPGKPSAHQVKHEANRLLAGSDADRPVHSCRLPSMIDFCDPRDWETQLLFYGLKQTYQDVEALRYKEKEPSPPCSKRDPDKLLFKIGEKGSGKGDFLYPRDVFATQNGDIVVADTNNHRVQIFSQFGVFKKQIGKKGKGEGEFLEPTGVAQFPNDDLVVADSKNQRIQIFSVAGKFKTALKTKSEPYSVCVDSFKNIVVATRNRTIEIYDRNMKLVNEFTLPGMKQKPSFLKMCLNSNEEVFLADSTSGSIKRFSYDGKLKHEFQPQAMGEGLAVIPSDLDLDVLGQLIVSDCLNHTINVYSTEGVLIRQVLRPPDELGAAFAISVGPEGHIVTSEFALASEHCVKIFRYTKCDCHASRPSSSKKRALTTAIS